MDRLGIQTAAAQFCHQFVICILYQEDTKGVIRIRKYCT